MLRTSALPALAGALVVGTLGGCLSFLFPYAPDNVAETLARAQCAFAYRCCEPAERDQAASGFSGFRNEDECVASALEDSSSLKLFGLRAKAVIDDGKGEFDGELADECLKPIIDAAYACDAEALLGRPTQSPECTVGLANLFVVGNIDDGDECTDDIECADEGSCVVEEEANTITVTGKCVSRAGKGETCANIETGEFVKGCQAGLACGGDGKCAAIELKENGAECFGSEECKSGRCNETTEDGTCSSSGEACTNDDDCRACFTAGTPCSIDTDCNVADGDFCSFSDFCDVSTRTVCSNDAPKIEICDGT